MTLDSLERLTLAASAIPARLDFSGKRKYQYCISSFVIGLQENEAIVVITGNLNNDTKVIIFFYTDISR